MAESIAYRSIAQLNNTIMKNIAKFPKDIDLIVGIPRSGMLPANLLALYMNKPYTDIESFLEGKVYACGYRGNYIKEKGVKKVLIIDDSVSSGSAMQKAKAKLKGLNYNFLFAAVYVRNTSKNVVNIFCEVVDGLRVFEWNMFHHRAILASSCLDIDGVLCRDPTPEENDDGEKYHKFLLTVEPKFIPTVKIKTLISCRLEKYRNETMFWLKKHGIEYENLIMLNLPNAEERRKWNKYGNYKGTEYKKPGYVFFIESSLNEAKKIKEVSGKTVFCTETMSIL